MRQPFRVWKRSLNEESSFPTNEVNAFEIRFEFRAIKKNQARISTFLEALPILISRTGDDGRHLVPHGETFGAVTAAFRSFVIYRRKW